MPVAQNRLETLQVCKLLQCVREKDRDQIIKMINSGIHQLINYSDATHGITALSVTACSNDFEMMDFLLSLGAHPDVRDIKGRTAAMRAAQYGHVECLERLVKAGADMNLVDVDGKGIIFYCFTPTQRHSRCLEIAVSNGANVNNLTKDGIPVFLSCCESAKENENMCLVLLQKGAEPNSFQEKTGRTALMSAAASGSVKVVRAILEAGGDVNPLDVRKNHAAHFAAGGGHLAVLACMAGYGADFNATNMEGNTPIHLAAMNGHGLCIRFLSQRGCNPKPKNNEGNTARAIAKEESHKEAVKESRKAERTFGKRGKNNEPWAIRLYDWVYEHQSKLLETFGKYDVEKVGKVLKEDFIECLQSMGIPLDEDQLGKVLSLYDRGREGTIDYNDFISAKKYINKNYMMSAFEKKKKKKKKRGKKGKKGKFKLVLPICTRDEGPRTAGGGPPEMYIPRHINFTDTSRFDRDHPPTHPLQDDSAWYLQHPDQSHININDAAKMGDFDSLRNAINRGVSIDTRDKYYKTPLMVAAAAGHLTMVKYLLENGAQVNARDNFKWTPLHHACHAGQLDIIELLLQHGAEIDTPTLSNGTPLTKAIESSREKVVQYLIDRGAKIQTENKKGLNPLDLAMSWADVRVIEIVQKKWDSLPPPADKGKKGKKPAAKSKRPASAPGTHKEGGGATTSRSIEEFLALRKGSILRAASALAGGLPEREDITYTPLKAWTKQPTTEELIEARKLKRERFGWEVDFEDFEMPFQRNISNKLKELALEE